MSCQQVLSRLWREKITRPVRVAFFSSFIVGLLTYLFAMTNILFLTGDALNNVYFDGNLIWLGRWSSQWLSSLSTNYTMPYVNGMIMLMSIAGLSALLVAVFEIKSSLLALMSAGVLTCFPTVSKTLGFLHNADAYLLAVMGLFVLERCCWGFVPAVLLIAIGTGTYQACATLVIGMMFVRGVQLTVCSEQNARALARRALRYALCIAAALALYYGMALWFSQRTGLEIGEYQSVEAAASVDTLRLLPGNFVQCYRDFWQAFTVLSELPEYQASGWPPVVFGALSVLMCFVVFGVKQGGKWGRLELLCLLWALAPFLLCSIRAFNPDKVYALMTYSVSGLYLLGMVMLDELPGVLERLKGKRTVAVFLSGASWVMLACTVVCLFHWTVSANLEFYLARMDYENMYAQCSAYLARAESSEDYVQGMPIVVIGESGYNSGRAPTAMYQSKFYYSFMNYCLRVDMPMGVANDVRDQARALADTEDFLLMPCYPEEGCVQAIGDYMVVKLGEVVY
ncbi:MAG: glucosyltransferase domain-containing protein [Clostridiales bacterium]|nr:glucosyltransferase domain-containing protein [Clostridiales bacterium]